MHTLESSEQVVSAPAPQLLTFPLSFAEQRLWFLDKLEPGLSIYNVSEAIRLKGQLNIPALERAINEIVRRHESLRTTFEEVDGEPVQVVAPSLTLRIALDDLTHLPAGQREQEATRRASDDANRPFDLQRGPLLRLLLLRLDADDHVLLINMHHIVSEGGWSMGVFLGELNTLYNSFSAGRPSPLRELEIQYGDYTTWQRDWMQGEVQEKLLDYWKEQLKGAPAVLDLPSDRPRLARQSYAGAKESHLLPLSLKTRLNDFSAAQGATMFMSLCAGFKTLLHRYTQQEDVVVGLAVAGRGSPQTHDLIGFFVNTLALRTDLSGDPSFRDATFRIRKNCLAAYSHEDLPFEVLVDALKPERSMAYSPVVQVVFSYQNTPREELHLTGVQSSPFAIESRTSMFDLTLLAWERPDGVLLTLQYSTDLFDRATVQRMLRNFEVLLAGAMTNPEAPISQLPLLDDAERRRILMDWNAATAEYPAERSIHELFEEQARKTPDAVALTFKDSSMSYGELNRRANQLAHYLKNLGVGPDSLVAICVERGFDMLVSLLGVLKAGGAYVPLDPAYPSGRLRYMLQDSAPVALLTEPHLKERFGDPGEICPVLELGRAEPAWKDQPDTNLNAAGAGLRPGNLAYVIYTSGSTGKPKGVMVEHGNVARLLTATDAWYHFGPKDVWTLFHSYAFDFSVWEIWGALLYGGRLVIAPQDVARSPEEFYKLICREKVTILNQTPSAFRQLIAVQGESAGVHALRHVIFGGEALEVASLKPWYGRKVNQRTQLVNMYGITETTVHVTYRPLEPADTERHGASPIGCRIPDLRIYILDPHGQPVPIGVVGELYVGGAGVARGYLNRPELTAQRFLRDPFVEGGNERMYKAGDLGRWLADGSIEFLGRNDFQVKIRGFRVELGEIEARLAEQPGVGEAVVIAREDTPGDTRLVAYYTGDGQDAVPRAELFRAQLAVRLPDYMVPAAYVRLESFPLTPNGKLDRKALPAPETASYAVRSYEAPVGEIETKLVAIWEDVLKVRPIGVRDNYFDLGGYSLLAVKLFSEIKKAFGLDLPLATLYTAPTVELCANVIAQNGETALWSSLVPIRREGSKPPFYFVSGVGGGVLVFRDLAVYLGADQPVYALQPKALVENEYHPTTIEEMAAHYVEQIRAAQPEGPYYIGGYSLGGFIAYEMAQQLTDGGHEVAYLALFDANAPLRMVRSKTSLIPERTIGSRWERLVEVLRSKDKLAIVKTRIKNRRTWIKEKLARALGSRPAELVTLEGSQKFAGTNYIGRPYSGVVTLFRSSERPPDEPWSYQLGWEKLAAGVEVHDVPGDHLTMYTGSNIAVLSDKLKATLNQAQLNREAVLIAGA